MAGTASDPRLVNSVGRGDFQFFWFSELLKRPVCAGKIENRLGKLSDLVFQLTEPHPEAAGVYIEHGWGKPTEFIPWDRVIGIEPDALLVMPPETGDTYPPFVDQPGWILINQHLMGKTILDTDGRRVEVVNDVHLLYSRGRMIVIHVDASFNGFMRKWGLGSVRWIKDRLISWKYVQPFSVEDAVTGDTVSLSVRKESALDLPGEDLADVLEMLFGKGAGGLLCRPRFREGRGNFDPCGAQGQEAVVRRAAKGKSPKHTLGAVGTAARRSLLRPPL